MYMERKNISQCSFKSPNEEKKLADLQFSFLLLGKMVVNDCLIIYYGWFCCIGLIAVKHDGFTAS